MHHSEATAQVRLGASTLLTDQSVVCSKEPPPSEKCNPAALLRLLMEVACLMPSLVHISLAGFTSTWDDCHMEGLSKLLQTGILSLDLRGVLFTSPQAQDLYDQIHKSCLLQVKFDTEQQPFHLFAIQKEDEEEELCNFLSAVEETLLYNGKNTDCLQMVTNAFDKHAEDTFWAIIQSQFGTTACALTKIRSNRTTGYQQQSTD